MSKKVKYFGLQNLWLIVLVNVFLKHIDFVPMFLKAEQYEIQSYTVEQYKCLSWSEIKKQIKL